MEEETGGWTSRACCLEHSEPGLMLHRCQDDPHVSKGLRLLALSSAGHGWILVPDAGLDG